MQVVDRVALGSFSRDFARLAMQSAASSSSPFSAGSCAVSPAEVAASSSLGPDSVAEAELGSTGSESD